MIKKIIRVGRTRIWPFVRRNHKDRLFIKLFSDKNALLNLYNALNGSNYTNPEDLTITTIDNVIFLAMKNDISFIINNYINLWEHQSTFCPNMPIRGLLYLAKQYESYIEERGYNIYGSKRIMLPTPRYVVFYNGSEAREDIEYLHLSDSFMDKDTELEFTAVVYNINVGHNEEIMKQCRTLHEYSQFIGSVDRYIKAGYDRKKAINLAVDYCISNDILRDFLIKHRSEVKSVLLTEYDEKRQRRFDREEGREEGIEAGKTTIILEIIQEKHKRGKSLSRIAEDLDREEADIKVLYDLVVENPEMSPEEIYHMYKDIL